MGCVVASLLFDCEACVLASLLCVSDTDFFFFCRFAYIEFADKESVRTAMALDESLFRGRQIKVSLWPRWCQLGLLSDTPDFDPVLHAMCWQTVTGY